MLTRSLLAGILLLLIQVDFVRAEAGPDAGAQLIVALKPLLDVVADKTDSYTLRAEFNVAGKTGTATLGRLSSRDYWLQIKAEKDIEGSLSVSSSETRLEIGPKNTAFVGKGGIVITDDSLLPAKLVTQASRLHQGAFTAINLIQSGNREALGATLNLLANIKVIDSTPGSRTFTVTVDKQSIELRSYDDAGVWRGELRFLDKAAQNWVKVSLTKDATRPALTAGRTEIVVTRQELERTLQRGGLRALDIYHDDLHANLPPDSITDIPGARLVIANGQRVCYLTGTPAEMGRAHGRLLRKEIRKVTDSTLHVVGLAYSIGKGKWFLDDIRDAWKRLEPHIEKKHIEELDGMAEGAGIDPSEMRLANVFPELFHCSGFAIANEATVGGKLFHGRVLDYMTEIGLQHAQVDFVMHGANARATVNIGYAGFIGCVTGMNDAQISMGEMGGRGEGAWDGTPMAFLMRRVLENAESLSQAREILSTAKRTCEYYYVVADGKTRSAVGVAAWPEKIEFIQQGEKHKMLPNALPGCVLLSAEKRYELLSERTKTGFGKLDEAGALLLMSRPVAMSSNLHSVLFVPEDLIYHAAHASVRGHRPATETKYVRHDFKEQIKTLKEIGTGK